MIKLILFEIENRRLIQSLEGVSEDYLRIGKALLARIVCIPETKRALAEQDNNAT
jgi:hypothetical protein